MANTTTPTVPIDLLGAVNELLNAIGQSEIASLQDADLSEKASQALAMLNREAVIVQSMPWNYNTEQDYVIDPSMDGSIVFPANCLAARVNAYSANWKLGTRGNRAYDLQHSTFNIGQPIHFEMTVALDFSDIPAPIRWYIVAKAGRRYAVNEIPSDASARFTTQVEHDALYMALSYDESETSGSMAELSPHMQMMRRR